MRNPSLENKHQWFPSAHSTLLLGISSLGLRKGGTGQDMDQHLSDQQLPMAPLRNTTGAPMGTHTGELSQAHSTFPEPSEGQMESPGPEITRLELKVTQGSLAGGWTWKWEGRDVRGSVHSFCSPTLVVSVELQYFPVSEVAINSVLHVPVLSEALRVDTHCNSPDCQSQR